MTILTTRGRVTTRATRHIRSAESSDSLVTLCRFQSFDARFSRRFSRSRVMHAPVRSFMRAARRPSARARRRATRRRKIFSRHARF
jgi:hypothetical protein